MVVERSDTRELEGKRKREREREREERKCEVGELSFSVNSHAASFSSLFVSSSFRQIIVPPFWRNIMIHLEGIYLRVYPSTCLRSCLSRMKLSREVAYKYITIRTQYSSFVGVLAIPEPSDFPFCSAQRDSDSSVYVHVCMYVRMSSFAETRPYKYVPYRPEKYNSVDTSIRSRPKMVARNSRISILLPPPILIF